MLFSKASVVFGLVAVSEALSIREVGGELLPRAAPVVNRRQANTCLAENAVQTGSASTGQDPPVAGQRPSETDSSNFINYCSGSTVTNGLQVKEGSCNGIVMGKIPSTSNMISAIIVSPKPGENLAEGQTFTMSVQITGLDAGAFTNAQATYYAAPQDLNDNGQIIGHTHLTVQDLGADLEPTSPPDPQKFVFFKGINDVGNGNGLLSATVTGGLPAGNYRVCSMTSTSNHQPVLMPVAQRGAQDDCQKFTVGGNGGGGNGGGGATPPASSSAASSAAASSAAASSAAASTPPAATSAAATSAAQASRTTTAATATGTARPLGGIAAPAITRTGNRARPFAVAGNTFTTLAAAKQRSCDIQRNACQNAVNSRRLRNVTIADCANQARTCLAS